MSSDPEPDGIERPSNDRVPDNLELIANVALFARDHEGGRHVLLVKPDRYREEGPVTEWVLPGGRLEPGETTEQAVRRHLTEATGVDLGQPCDGTALIQCGVWDAPERDPRSRVVAVAYTAYLDEAGLPGLSAGDGIHDVSWHPVTGWGSVEDLPLALDHPQMVRTAWQHLTEQHPPSPATGCGRWYWPGSCRPATLLAPR